MITDLATLFFRRVPEHLAVAVASGEYGVYGSVIRSIATGQIKGWLTEAGGMAPIAEAALKGAPGLVAAGPAGFPVAVANLALNAVHIVQNQQIKAGIETLRQLQIGGMALSAAGIGVSVVGFAILSRKIDRVGASVEAIGDKLDRLAAKVDELGREPVQRDLDGLRTAAREMDGGWLLNSETSARNHWEEVARSSNRLVTGFQRRSRDLLDDGVAALAVAEPMLDALALASALRVSAWAAAGEEQYAQEAAAEGARALDSLTGRIGVADLTSHRLIEDGVAPGTTDYHEALQRATDAARPVALGLREREAATATRGATLEELTRRGIRARDWMEAAREEKDSPVLLLPVES